MNTITAFPPLKKALTCSILLFVLFASVHVALCQESGPKPVPDNSNATRRDYYVGTTHEGIVMEQDPVTGDRVIQVTPPPREEQQTQPPTLLIQPEIKIRTK